MKNDVDLNPIQGSSAFFPGEWLTAFECLSTNHLHCLAWTYISLKHCNFKPSAIYSFRWDEPVKQFSAADIVRYEAHLALKALEPTDKAERQLIAMEVRCRYTPSISYIHVP